MKGDDAVRHCGSCKKSVYQLSNMSSAQVEALLADSKEERCVRFYQRKDGTLLTEDCAVGVRRKRRKLAVVGAGMSVLSALGVAMAGGTDGASSAAGTSIPELVATPTEIVPQVAVTPPVAPEPPSEEYELVMGAMVAIDFEETPERSLEHSDENEHILEQAKMDYEPSGTNEP